MYLPVILIPFREEGRETGWFFILFDLDYGSPVSVHRREFKIILKQKVNQ